MDPRLLVDGLIMYLGMVVLLTFHEFGHAWMALRCGDDTAKSQGRVSLNPLVHIDQFGTVLMPLMMIYLGASNSNLGRFLIGWAKPVPVNPQNLRNPRVDDILVILAGPWMNLLLAIVIMGFARIGMAVHAPNVVDLCIKMAHLSMMLCFFNLIPIPPLDGSQVLRSLVGMSYETYNEISRYSWFILIIVWQVPFVRGTINAITDQTLLLIADWFGMPSRY